MRDTYFIFVFLFILYTESCMCLSENSNLSFEIEEQLKPKVKTRVEKIDQVIHEILDILSKQNSQRSYDRYEVSPTPKTGVKARDCTELKQNGINESSAYEVWPEKRTTKPFSFDVYCDMETDGGGWTVFQRRGDFGHPKDYFLRNWKNYSEGFGEVNEDFWLGNDKIHSLTDQGNYSLRIDMKDKEGNKRYAQYSSFKIGNENDFYKLQVSGYKGDAGDSLIPHHNNRNFTTFDNDNDEARSLNCATLYKGAWWYNGCYESNLNGLYLNGRHTSFGDGIEWYTWKGLYYSLPDVEMKMRRN